MCSHGILLNVLKNSVKRSYENLTTAMRAFCICLLASLLGHGTGDQLPLKPFYQLAELRVNGKALATRRSPAPCSPGATQTGGDRRRPRSSRSNWALCPQPHLIPTRTSSVLLTCHQVDHHGRGLVQQQRWRCLRPVRSSGRQPVAFPFLETKLVQRFHGLRLRLAYNEINRLQPPVPKPHNASYVAPQNSPCLSEH